MDTMAFHGMDRLILGSSFGQTTMTSHDLFRFQEMKTADENGTRPWHFNQSDIYYVNDHTNPPT